MKAFTGKKLNRTAKERQPISAEHFKRQNKKIAAKSREKCILTDAEKVKNGTHRWVRTTRGLKLERIEPIV